MAQFRAFTGSRCGKRPTCFAQKLVGQGHAPCLRSGSYSRPVSSLFQKSLRSDG
jgi:hypothetical protein